MNYNLRRPCPHCPFRSDIDPYIRAERAVEIARSLVRSEFPCHQTTVEDPEDESQRITTRSSEHCAGALIMLEKANEPSQMMRICQRIGFYDPSALDMDAPVYDSPADFIDAHECNQ